MFFIRLISTILILSPIFGFCAEGCLKCNEKNECSICDIVNNYVLVEKKCEF